MFLYPAFLLQRGYIYIILADHFFKIRGRTSTQQAHFNSCSILFNPNSTYLSQKLYHLKLQNSLVKLHKKIKNEFVHEFEHTLVFSFNHLKNVHYTNCTNYSQSQKYHSFIPKNPYNQAIFSNSSI